MKLLVVTPTFLPVMGGAESGIAEIVRRLAVRHEVRVLAPRPSVRQAREFGMDEPAPDLANVSLTRFRDRLNPKAWPGQGLTRGLIPPFSAAMAAAAWRAARRFRPDVALVFYALPSGAAALLLETMCRVPVVLHLIGRDIPGPDIPPFWGAYARLVSRRVTRLAFISGYGRTAVLGAGSTGGEIVPFGVDTERFRPGLDGGAVRRRLGISPDAAVLFGLQRLDPWKRADVVLRAHALVLRETDAVLVVGGKGPEAAGLRRLARELGTASRVVFTGYIDEADLPGHFAAADLFVFHSTYETFGVALVQAMASGLAVATVRSTAIPETVGNGLCGPLVPPLDPPALAAAILDLLRDDEKRRRLGAAARAAAVERFSWDVVIPRLERLLAAAAGRAGAGAKPAFPET